MSRIGLLFLTGILFLTACSAGEKAASAPTASTEAVPAVSAEAEAVPALSAEAEAVPAVSAEAEASSEGAFAASTDAGTGRPSDIDDIDAQLQLIADSSDEWTADDEYAEYWYAVTDLDRDGNLEVIAASQQGSGLYTWFSIYEVNEDRTGLDLLPDNLGQGESGPDLITDAAQAVEKDGIIYYYFEDVLRISPAEHLATMMTLSLENDQAVVRPLASVHTGPELDENGEAKEDSYIEEYFDGEEKGISSEEFNALTAVPDGCENTGFGWTDLSDGSGVEALRESFDAFKPLPDA